MLYVKIPLFAVILKTEIKTNLIIISMLTKFNRCKNTAILINLFLKCTFVHPIL